MVVDVISEAQKQTKPSSNELISNETLMCVFNVRHSVTNAHKSKSK